MTKMVMGKIPYRAVVLTATIPIQASTVQSLKSGMTALTRTVMANLTSIKMVMDRIRANMVAQTAMI